MGSDRPRRVRSALDAALRRPDHGTQADPAATARAVPPRAARPAVPVQHRPAGASRRARTADRRSGAARRGTRGAGPVNVRQIISGAGPFDAITTEALTFRSYFLAWGWAGS